MPAAPYLATVGFCGFLNAIPLKPIEMFPFEGIWRIRHRHNRRCPGTFSTAVVIESLMGFLGLTDVNVLSRLAKKQVDCLMTAVVIFTLVERIELHARDKNCPHTFLGCCSNLNSPGLRSAWHRDEDFSVWRSTLTSAFPTKRSAGNLAGCSHSPDQGALQNSARLRRSLRMRCQSTVSEVQEPCGPGWSFCGRQKLDATRVDQIVLIAVDGPGRLFSLTPQTRFRTGSARRRPNAPDYTVAARSSIAGAKNRQTARAGELCRAERVPEPRARGGFRPKLPPPQADSLNSPRGRLDVFGQTI